MEQGDVIVDDEETDERNYQTSAKEKSRNEKIQSRNRKDKTQSQYKIREKIEDKGV